MIDRLPQQIWVKQRCRPIVRWQKVCLWQSWIWGAAIFSAVLTPGLVTRGCAAMWVSVLNLSNPRWKSQLQRGPEDWGHFASRTECVKILGPWEWISSQEMTKPPQECCSLWRLTAGLSHLEQVFMLWLNIMNAFEGSRRHVYQTYSMSSGFHRQNR